MIEKIKIILLAIISIVLLSLISPRANATGVAGLTYYTYQGTGASPSIDPLTYPTVRSTGVSASINYPSGSFGSNLLGSGLIDRVIVHWVGYINIPTTGVYYFGAAADDGFKIYIDGTLNVNSWVDYGGQLRTGNATTLTVGAHAIDVWYYENGGGQSMIFQYSTNNTTWSVVPTTMLATDSTYWTPVAPTLCCGGSSASFSATPSDVAKVVTFTNTTNRGNQVYIEQIGNSNTVTVEQTGPTGNYTNYYGNGFGNNISVTQKSNVATQINYVDLTVNGNSNTVSLTQQTAGETNSFSKGIFATVSDNNNSLIVQQKNGGNHYAAINLSGGNKNVDITQQGSAAHMASVGLSGNPVDLSLTQAGSTQQFYSINFNCATVGGCPKITVQQGQ